ncbi:hypothetical protein SZ63_03930 [Methanoculleus sediminis]|uniref:Uncharacterized protein n=1 Tax=Methanoculleus sediminis TaxID=1550566 RepID=A0A0H1R674_9EURY|nr:hypothetical protein SZ63_03930 [Methanoculleus sediminis]
MTGTSGTVRRRRSKAAAPRPPVRSRSRSTTSIPPPDTAAKPFSGRSQWINSTSRPHSRSISPRLPGLFPINSTRKGSLMVSLASRAGTCPYRCRFRFPGRRRPPRA